MPDPDATPFEEIDAIYRAAPIGLCVLDRGLRYVRVNDRLAEINRLPAAAHLGRRVGEVLPEIAATVEPILQRVLDTGESIQNVEISTPDDPPGAARTVVMHCLPLRGPDNAIVGINVVAEDITLRKQTAERLRSTERRLWLLTEHCPLAVIEWDANYRVTRWGGAAESMFGWKAEEVLGQSIGRLHMVVEEDWPIVRGALGRLNAADTPHVVSSNRNYTRDRRVITCEWYNSAVADAEGRLGWVLSLVVDVTEQRRSHAEQFLLAEASRILSETREPALALGDLARLPVPMLADWCGLGISPSDPRFRAIDQGAATHGDAQAVARALMEAATSPEPRELFAEPFGSGRSLLMDGRDVDELFGKLRLAPPSQGGPRVPRSLLVIPLRVAERLLGVWTWGRTRAERFDDRDLVLGEELARRAATAILNAELFDAVDRANRTKDQFLATLGHELRQPLGALTSAVSLLRETATSDASLRVWSVANRQLTHVARLVDDLLDLTRIERGKVVLQRKLLDLRTIVNDAADACAHVLGERRQHLDLAMPPDPVPVVGDASRLQQVVSNLLSNASKFSPHSGTIHLTVEVDEEFGRIAVRDTGRGIPRAALESIFEPFAQAGESTGGGLGIGLAVVRQLVQLHHGTVTAQSEGEGRGSEFVVMLPLAVPDRHAQGRNS